MRKITIALAAAMSLTAWLPAEASAVLKQRQAPRAEAISFDVTASDIVFDTPAGEKTMKSKSGKYYGNSLWGISEGEAKGIPCVTVEDTDNSFWIYNPFTAIDTKSWLKGEIDNDRLTFKLPQAIYTDSDGTVDYVYVAQMCYFEWLDGSQEEGVYHAYDGETEMVFVKEDGKWVMQQPEQVNDHPVIMGLIAADDGTWCAYSEWQTVLEDFHGETVLVPDNLVAEPWALLAFSRESNSYPGGKYVDVGFDGDDVYVKGLSSALPDSWVKGRVEEGEIKFPSRQYLGAEEMLNMFGFFYGATEEEKYNEEWDFYYYETVFQDNLTFQYDAEKKTMSSEGTIVINKGDADVNMNESFSAPIVKLQGAIEDFTPANPVPGYYSPVQDNYMGAVYFDFPNINKEGQILDTDHMYYTVYIDEDPMTFYPDEYEGLEEGTDELAFDFTNQNTIGYYGLFGTTHFFYFSAEGFESMDIQTIYREGEKEYRSDIVRVVGPSKIDEVERYDGEVTRERWYDISGRLISSPKKGIYIREREYSDGRVVRTKVTI